MDDDNNDDNNDEEQWRSCKVLSWDIENGKCTLVLDHTNGVMVCMSNTIFWIKEKEKDFEVQGNRSKKFKSAKVSLGRWESSSCTFVNGQVLFREEESFPNPPKTNT